MPWHGRGLRAAVEDFRGFRKIAAMRKERKGGVLRKQTDFKKHLLSNLPHRKSTELPQFLGIFHSPLT